MPSDNLMAETICYSTRKGAVGRDGKSEWQCESSFVSLMMKHEGAHEVRRREREENTHNGHEERKHTESERDRETERKNECTSREREREKCKKCMSVHLTLPGDSVNNGLRLSLRFDD